MNNQRIALITDTGTNTQPDVIEAADVEVVPLRVIFSDGETFNSPDLSEAELVRRFETEIPTTSLPSPQQILNAYEHVHEKGYTHAFFISIAGALSATAQTARMLSDQVEGLTVEVLDSKNIGPGAGLLVRECARMVLGGASFEEILSKWDTLVSHAHIFFAMPTLTYLRKGGRISEAVYRVGSVLNIKPVMTCASDGSYAIKKKVRGWQKALDEEINQAVAAAANYTAVRVLVCCSDACSEHFDYMEMQIKAKISNIVDFYRSGISADLLVHTGPALVGVTLCEAMS